MYFLVLLRYLFSSDAGCDEDDLAIMRFAEYDEPFL